MKRKDTSTFIKEATKVHNGKFSYESTEYLSAHSLVTITCKLHGEFSQRANDHLVGKGCNSCANQSRSIKTGTGKRKSRESYIKDAIKVHGTKYDYDKLKYNHSHDKVEICCRKHGSFWQSASSHLSGYGCTKCSQNSSSKMENTWLDLLGISDDNKQHQIFINRKRLSVDGYDPNTNIVYEFYGDFWHGNPLKYYYDAHHPMLNKTFGQLFERTIDKENRLKEAGYIVCSLWEDDINDLPVYSKRIIGN